MLSDNDTICLDVGQNQMWAAQSMMITRNQRMLISGGMGAMGFSLPAAIGAYYSDPKRNVIAVTGDGGLQMNIQVLALIRRNNIPVKIIVMNNCCLGMIRHFQELYFDSRFYGTIIDYEAPDFRRIADAYGIRSIRAENMDEVYGLKDILASDGPALIDISLPRYTYVYPKLEVGRPIEDQDPLVPREELYANMIVKPFISGNAEGNQS
jgi:acetolactate synthase-1/2/3 large subunit